MESQLTLHLKSFNNKVKVMNQTNAKDITLTALEARNLHNDIFDLLSKIAGLTEVKETPADVDSLDFDGGNF